MNMMSRVAAVALGAAALGSSPAVADAQTKLPFTWQSQGSVVCLNVSCTSTEWTLGLTGFGVDVNGTSMTSLGATYDAAASSPANASGPISTPGFIRGFSISSLAGSGVTFDAALDGTMQGGFMLSVTDGGRTLLGSRLTSPFPNSPITLLATLAGDVSAATFEYAGSAYLANNADYTWTGSNGSLYDVGAFAGAIQANVIPEPSTYLLMATGLAGLVVLGRRRRA